MGLGMRKVEYGDLPWRQTPPTVPYDEGIVHLSPFSRFIVGD
jgi:hypothetical protein